MSCRNNCKLCRNLVISNSVTFTGGNLIINIPAGSYRDCERICIVVAQTIPATATINAPVFVTIGTGTQLYPLNRCDCSQAVACDIHTRTRYATRVVTTPTGGSFRLLGKTCCCSDNDLRAINGTAPVTTTALAERGV